MRFGVVVFPGTWSDCDFHYVIREVLHQPVGTSGTGTPMLADFDCLDPAGRLLLRRLPAGGRRGGRSPVVEALPELRGPRRARAGLLQRLPDPVRGRPPARRAHAQRVPAVPLPVDPRSRVEQRRDARSPAALRPRPGAQDADLPRRGQVLRRAGHAPPAPGAATRSSSATRRRTARSRRTRIRTARSENIAGVVERGGHGRSGSCRIPSARPRPRWAAPTDC